MQLAFTGDVMLGRLVNEIIKQKGPKYCWGDTLDLIKKTDLRFINLECVIAKNGKPWSRTPKVFHFRADPVAIDVLKEAKINYVSLANNHVLDFEEDAFLEMLSILEENKIKYSGAGRNISDASKATFLQTNKLKVAVVAFTDNEPVWEAGENKPGINYIPIDIENEKYFSRLERSIKETKKNCDILIASSHWGPHIRYIFPNFKVFARKLIDMGVDIFYGHGAHYFKGVEIYKKKVIMYDCGDFIDDYAVDPWERNDQSFLFVIEVVDRKIKMVKMYPTVIYAMQTNLAKGILFDDISFRMKYLCEQLDTKIKVTKNNLLISV